MKRKNLLKRGLAVMLVFVMTAQTVAVSAADFGDGEGVSDVEISHNISTDEGEAGDETLFSDEGSDEENQNTTAVSDADTIKTENDISLDINPNSNEEEEYVEISDEINTIEETVTSTTEIEPEYNSNDLENAESKTAEVPETFVSEDEIVDTVGITDDNTNVSTSHSYKTLTFGSYPLEKVKDKEITSALEKLSAGHERGEEYDIVYNGKKYFHNSGNEWVLYEPIEWVILNEAGGKTYIMSKYCLVGRSFGKINSMSGIWSDADIHTWLNETFYNRAFDDQEKRCIYNSEIVSCIDVHGDHNKTVTTSDKVFLISCDEVESYLSDDLKVATYYSGTEPTSWYTRCSAPYYHVWTYPKWLNTEGNFQSNYPANWGRGIRPCLYINTKKLNEINAELEKEKNVSYASVNLSKTNYTYDGKAKMPTVTVKLGSVTLKKNTDFTVTYSDNIYVGTGSVTISGIGNYIGSIIKNFTIKGNKKVVIKFDSCSGKISKTKKDVYYGEKYGSLPKATRKGYAFVGWYTAKNGGTKVTSDSYCKKKGMHTLYAHWKIVTYSITYNYDGGTQIGQKDTSTTYTIKDTITLACPRKTGYKFMDWYQDKNFKKKITKISKGSTGDKVLYAKWSPIKYYVYYYGNGATSGKDYLDKNAKLYGKSYSLKANWFKKKGYTFKGWAVASYKNALKEQKKDGMEVQFEDKTSYKNLKKEDGETVCLYAVWEPIAYKITYKGINTYKSKEFQNFSLGENPETYTCKKTVFLKKPIVIGYKFNGWYSDKNLNKKISKISKDAYKNMTIYASFTPIIYTVSFNGNGATAGSMGKMTCLYDKSYSLTVNQFTDDVQFTGWNTAPDGSGTSYADGATIKNLTAQNNQTITLYAQWLKYKMLPVNWKLINSIGKQASGSNSCPCFALAYCCAILDGKKHEWYEYNLNGKDQNDVYASWSKGGYALYKDASEQTVLLQIYNNINNGYPVIVYVNGSKSGKSTGHYVTVIGYSDVTNENALTLYNFWMIDPGYSNKAGDPEEGYANLGKYYDLKSDNGKYQYIIRK